MAEVALSEGKDLDELDREDENRIWEDLVFIVVIKTAVADEILPSSVPPGGSHSDAIPNDGSSALSVLRHADFKTF